MVRKIIYVIFIISIPYISVGAQNISVKASVDTTDYQVGDFITYTIKVTHPQAISIVPPMVKDSLKGIELIKNIPFTSGEKDGKIVTTYKYILAKYDSGDVHIPSIAVIYNQKGSKSSETIFSNPVYFTVHTLNVNPQADIKDVKEPIKIPLDWKIVLLWILIALVLIAAGIYGYLYYKKKRAQKLGIVIEIKREPHEIALESLHLLEEKKLWQQNLIKEYHSEITGIIRQYFNNRFNVSALELPTSEMLYELEQVPDAKKIIGTTTDFLNNADLVKFAKFVPMSSVNEEMMKQAYDIVYSTIVKKQTETEPELQNVEEAANV
jgi:hypothetical protein